MRSSGEDHFIRKLEAKCDELQAQIDALGEPANIKMNTAFRILQLTERYEKFKAILERHYEEND